MTDEVQFFRFRDDSLVLVTEAQQTEVQLEVADSWLVEDGRARSLDAHFDRFARWVSEVSPDCTPTLPAFFDAVLELAMGVCPGNRRAGYTV